MLNSFSNTMKTGFTWGSVVLVVLEYMSHTSRWWSINHIWGMSHLYREAVRYLYNLPIYRQVIVILDYGCSDGRVAFEWYLRPFPSSIPGHLERRLMTNEWPCQKTPNRHALIKSCESFLLIGFDHDLIAWSELLCHLSSTQDNRIY